MSGQSFRRTTDRRKLGRHTEDTYRYFSFAPMSLKALKAMSSMGGSWELTIRLISSGRLLMAPMPIVFSLLWFKSLQEKLHVSF